MGFRLDFERATQTTDLRWRLEQIPADAAVRGMFLNMLDDRARELSEEAQLAYRDYFKIHRFSPFKMYPCRDYLTRLVLLADAAFEGDAHRGMRYLQAQAFPSVRNTLLGRSWFALFGAELTDVLRQMCRTFGSVTNFGSTELVEGEPLVLRFRQQYVYIEHAMVGAVEGVGLACHAPIRVDVKMIDPFNGDLAVERLPAELGAPR